MPRIVFITKKKTALRSRASSFEEVQIQAVNSCAQQVAAKVTLSLLSPEHAQQMAPLLFLSSVKRKNTVTMKTFARSDKIMCF